MSVAHFSRAIFVAAASSLLMAFLAGCGSGSSDDTRLRLIHASPDSDSLDILVDDEVERSGVVYSEVTDYFKVENGTRRLRVFPASSNLPAIDFSTRLSEGFDYTLVATGFEGAVDPLLLVDDNTDPDFGEIKLRIVHAAPSMGRIDIYVTREGRDISDIEPEFSNVLFTEDTEYLEINEGEYQIRVTPARTKSVILDTGGIRFRDQDVRSIVLFDNAGGGAPFRSTVVADEN